MNYSMGRYVSSYVYAACVSLSLISQNAYGHSEDHVTEAVLKDMVEWIEDKTPYSVKDTEIPISWTNQVHLQMLSRGTYDPDIVISALTLSDGRILMWEGKKTDPSLWGVLLHELVHVGQARVEDWDHLSSLSPEERHLKHACREAEAYKYDKQWSEETGFPLAKRDNLLVTIYEAECSMGGIHGP